MANTDGQIVLGLDVPKTVKEINTDIKKLQNQLAQVKATGALDTSATVKQINAQIAALQAQLKTIKINAKIDAGNMNRTAQQAGANITRNIANGIKQSGSNVDIEAQKLADKVNKIMRSMDNGYGASDYQNRINGLVNDFQKYGIAIETAKTQTNSLQQIFNSMNGLSGQELVAQADKFEQEFKAVKISIDEAKLSYEKLKETENSMRGLGKLGALLKNQMSQAAQSFTKLFSASSAVTFLISKTKDALNELKQVNTLLTKISKANDKLSKSALDKIGNNSFDIASKYGKKATDYLSSIQEVSHSGYENVEEIAELSVAAQSTGDMTAELADQYLIATDKAYKFGGSVEKLTEVLDGSNYITNHNAVSMTELAESMSIVGSTAASFGVDVDEATAALGTMIATTQQSGSEVASAFKAILLNIRQVSDEEEGIDTEGLTKYENACNALNVKLKETKNGILSLRDPMEVLKDLSIEYNKLEESDSRRTELLSSVGDKATATQLDALLRQWDTYETMLQQYADGTGSMATEAEKTVNSWEGSMNRLSNTWTDTVGNIADSDAIITIINSLNGLLSVVNNVTDKLGSLGTIGVGAGLFAGLNNVGSPKMFGLKIVLNIPTVC